MDIKLVKITADEANDLWKMQVKAFLDLYEKYQDTETSPATEKVEKVIGRLRQSSTYFYKIMVEEICVGAIRIIDEKTDNMRKRISPLFILPKFNNL